jgi:hypothetical protein
VIRKKFYSCLAILVLLGSAGFLFGQAVTATLVGTITDQTGAVVPNATVTIKNEGTGASQQGAANGAGNYVFTFLQPGKYTVTVSSPSFEQISRHDIDVQVNTSTRVDLSLHPGANTTVVEVTGQIPMLQTDRADVSAQIQAKQVEDLPVGSQRNFQALQQLIPGVSRPIYDHSSFFDAQNSQSFQVNGQSEMSNNLQLEGIDDNERSGLLQVYIPPAAAIKTVDVETSNYAPEFGRSAGAVTNVILKSGTNQFHGSAYEFNQVSALAARTYFNNTGARPRQTNNYYGATLGGPIFKDKTFFFVDFLRYSNYQGQFQLVSVPTAAFRSGDLSAGPTAIYDPQTGNADGTGRTQFDYNGHANVIDPARLSPIAQKLLALVPLPNVPGAGFTNNYQANTGFNVTTHTYDAKIDQRVAANDLLTGRFGWQRTKTNQQPIFGLAGGPAASAFEGTGVNTVWNGAANYTHVVSPSLFTEFRGGVDHYRNTAHQSDYGTSASSEIGIPGVNLDPFTSGLVGMDIAGFSSPLVGYSASIPWVRAETSVVLSNNWTKILGNHSIKTGFEFRRIRDDLTQGQTYSPRGIYRYRDGETGLNVKGNKTGFTNDFASFLLDIPNQVGRDLNVNPASWRQSYYFAFIQDTWVATQKLTLTYGVRYEYYPPSTSGRKGGFSQYDPSNNTLQVSGYGDVKDDLGLQKNWQDFEPRVGFAYRARPGTVVRGGFGISKTAFQDNGYAYNFPVRQNSSFNALNSYGPALLPDGTPATLAKGFPTAPDPDIPSTGILSAPLNVNYTTVNTKFKDPTVVSYNMTVEQQFGKDWVFNIAYVGNQGKQIPAIYEMNHGQVAGAGAAGQPYYKLYGTTSSLQLRNKGTTSNYNSLQSRLTHHFSHGLSVTSGFTWQKAMGYISSTTGLAGLDFYLDPHRDYSPLGFNHSVTSANSFIYELPFGKGKRFLNQGVGSWILGGWQASGIVSLQTGSPLYFSASGSQLNTPNTRQMPNQTGPFRKLYGIGTNNAWFDTSSFTQPVGAVPGNVGKNVYSGPGSVTFDAAASRMFPIYDRVSLKFRMDAFNVMNHPSFNNPDVTLTDSNFGTVTGAGGSRALQLAATLSF